MSVPDKEWMKLTSQDRHSSEYFRGVDSFLDFAESSGRTTDIACPCVLCGNRNYFDRATVRTHLIVNGIRKNYKLWHCHGERRPQDENIWIEDDNIIEDDIIIEDDNSAIVVEDVNTLGGRNDMEVHHNMGEDTNLENANNALNYDFENDDACTGEDQPNDDAQFFYNVMKDSNEPLYIESRISKASTLLKLLHLKNIGHWTNSSFTMLLKLLKDEILPENSNLPNSYYESKKFLKEVGLSYEKIDACKNSCMLYRKEHKNLQACGVCGLSRWKTDHSGDVCLKNNGKKIPTKVLRYFPLTPRLKMLYLCPKTARNMRWHKDMRVDDQFLRHPADSVIWKTFDEEYKDFSLEPRNVRLGLASDGFQPFTNAKSSYSIWPVILIPYNLSPTLCMNPSNFILSMLIPGPESPGDAIDIYLAPLIEELDALWKNGVQTFDKSMSKSFTLRAALLWTINDFPAYANLSGWSTKGKLACPCCNNKTMSMRLKHGKKECYMGHRRFLPNSHKFRRERDLFDGSVENGMAPQILTGNEVLRQVQDLKGTILSRDCTKKTKISHKSRGDNWNKMSIFFELPYWESLWLRHNLDVMHIEKNICDSVLGTIMDINGKTKDTLNTRLDLQVMNIRHALHPVTIGGKLKCPEAPYALSSEGRKQFCQFLKDLKMPEGFCSNIGGCVNVSQSKISGLKSHDCHILLEYLIPLGTRGLLPDEVYKAIKDLSDFFRILCSKTLSREELETLDINIALTLCVLEKVFPPSFFDIMMHLPIHLPFEAFLGGPISFRWMYPIEQYMGILKTYVRNKNHPEASICEGYLLNEFISLSSRHFEHLSADIDHPNNSLSIFSSIEDLSTGTNYSFQEGDRECAHIYILKNCEEAEPFYSEYMQQCNGESDDEYMNWFRTRVQQLEDDSERTNGLKILGAGPTNSTTKFMWCKVNGYKFNTEKHDESLKTQNSGIYVVGNNGLETIDYYGVLTDIIELQYRNGKRVVVFKCKWFDMHSGENGIKIDKYGFVSVNFNRFLKTQKYDPFILATQAKQCFFVKDIKESNRSTNWKIAVKTNPRYSQF